MIDSQKIVFGEPLYFVPNYSGTVRVAVLKLLGSEKALVQQHSDRKNLKPFPVPIAHIYNRSEDAEKGRRAWETYRRKVAKRT